MKRMLPLIFGLVGGLGLGTGVYVMRGGDETAPTEVTEGAEAHDSTQVSHVDGASEADTTDTAVDVHPEGEQVAEPADTVDAQASAIAEALLAARDSALTERASEAPDDAVRDSREPTPEAGPVEAEGPTRAPATTELDPGSTTGNPPAESAVAGPADSTTDVEAGQPPGSPAELIGGPVENEEAAKRVAKIFSQMQPRDAARVLSLMERSEVELILKQLDNRSAAKILSGLTPEQAAALSAVLIRGGNR